MPRELLQLMEKRHSPNPATRARIANEPPPRVRRTTRLSREGLLWLLAALVLLSQGWLRNFNLVTLIGCMLLSMVIFNLAWVLTRFRTGQLIVKRQVVEPVFAGDSFAVILQVENTSAKPVLGVRISERGKHHAHEWLVSRVAGEESINRRYTLKIAQRGIYPWPTLTASSGYPFGLVRRSFRFGSNKQTIVLPALGTLNLHQLRRLAIAPDPAESASRRARRHPGAHAEFHGLRPYRSGDSLRSIHWRTSARMGEPMVREYEERPTNNLLLILEPCLAPGDTHGRPSSTARLELAVSLAATICWEWCKQPNAALALAILGENEVAVHEGGRKSAMELLERLALVRGRSDVAGSPLLQPIATESLPSGPAVMVSSGDSGAARRLTAALGRQVTLLNVSDPETAAIFQPNQCQQD